MVVSSIASTAPDRTPAPRPILGCSRTTGEPVALVPSSSQPNLSHLVTMDGPWSCKGYAFRKSCRHVTPAPRPLADGGAAHLAVQRAAGNWPAVSPEVAANAATYHSIFGRDE